MTTQEEFITNFYHAFAQKDTQSMEACYHPKATFRDPIFYLKQPSIMDMWRMLIERGADRKIELLKVRTRNNKVEATWKASYTFGSTGLPVVNTITSTFSFSENKIYQQNDHFDFYKWASQSLGLKGKLLGWSSFLQNSVRKQAMQRLESYSQTIQAN